MPFKQQGNKPNTWSTVLGNNCSAVSFIFPVLTVKACSIFTVVIILAQTDGTKKNKKTINWTLSNGIKEEI